MSEEEIDGWIDLLKADLESVRTKAKHAMKRAQLTAKSIEST